MLAALVVVAGAVASAHGGATAGLPVALTVREEAGVDRAGEPVTSGVPFSPGVLATGATLRLTDAAGKAVPLQQRVLAHWPDGSVKWVLLDFQASLDAGATAVYTLAKGKPAAPARPIRIQTRPDSLLVDTGAMQVTLNRKAFDLFRSVVVDGKQVVKGADRGGIEIAGADGVTRTSRANLAPGYTVEVVEAGPLRTVIRATGEVGATKDRRLGFTCWIHFHAGSRWVRVLLTMRNLDGKSFTGTDMGRAPDLTYQAAAGKHAGNLFVEAVDLVLPGVRPAGKPPFVFGGDEPIAGNLDDGSVQLYQDSSAGWTWQAGDGRIVDPILAAQRKWMLANVPEVARDRPFFEYQSHHYRRLRDQKHDCGCTFRGYKATTNRADRPEVQGDRARGWAQLGTTTVGVRWFWQMYPKAIELSSDGRIRLGLWPRQWAHRHLFEGHIHKTHELLFVFADAPGAAAAEASFRRFDRRLLATAPAAHYCASGAMFGMLMCEDRKRFAKFEDFGLTAVKCGVNPNIPPALDSSFQIEREKYDNFGVQHFGANSKRGWRGFAQYHYMDIEYCLLAHYARTLNRAFFDEAEIHARYLMDGPAHGGGYGHAKSESSHHYVTGALCYYYLTGLEHILESLRESHDVYGKPSPWHARSFAMTLTSNLDMYRQFGDKQYLEKIRSTLDWLAKPGYRGRSRQDPATGFTPYGNPGSHEFMLGMMMDALGRYGVEFPADAVWRDRLVAMADAAMREPTRKRLAAFNCNGFAYAYLFTGREKYLDFAIWLMERSFKWNDPKWPHYRTGTVSGKAWSLNGQRFVHTMMWARAHRDANGTPEPPAPITDLAARRVGGNVELTWTAPAQNGGPVDAYIVKRAAKPIRDELTKSEDGQTAANWWMIPRVAEAAPPPLAPGRKQRMTLAVPDGTSYVAVRSVRLAGPIAAISGLSNVARTSP